jgi:hypothetical protein
MMKGCWNCWNRDEDWETYYCSVDKHTLTCFSYDCEKWRDENEVD